MRFNSIIALTVLCLMGCAPTATEQLNPELLIKQVRIVSPQKSTAGNPTDVLIRNGIIHAIGLAAAKQAKNNVDVIDGTGRFLLPGLIDGHTHLGEVPGMTFEHEQAFPDVAADARRQIPRSYLYHGFTTVVDLNATPRTIDEWNSNDSRPQAYFCGAAPVFDGYPTNYLPKPLRYKIMPYFLYDESRASEFPKGVDRAHHSPAAIVKQIQTDGGICIKTHYETGFGAHENLPVPTLELVKELVSEAHKANLPVLLHANSQSAQSFGIKTGIDAFAHGMWNWNNKKATDLHPDITRLIDATITNGIALQPTIQVLYGERDVHNPDYLSDPRLRRVLPTSLIHWYETRDGQSWRNQMLNIPFVEKFVSEGLWEELSAPPIARVSVVLNDFAQKNGKLLFGSDTPSNLTFANPPGLNGRIEIDRWMAAGVTPAQIFNAMTLANAQFFALANDIGTIEEGKQADMLITQENPLVTVSAYDTIEYVILDGKVIKRASLSAQ